MREFEIINAHVHLYRDIDREKQALPIPGRRDRDRWGNANSIVPYLDRERVALAVGLNFYPTGVMRRVLRGRIPASLSMAEREDAEQQVEHGLASGLRHQNEWLCQLCRTPAASWPRLVSKSGSRRRSW